MFWDNFVKQCEAVEKSPSIVSEELGFNRSAVTAWKNGALPRVASRKKIAEGELTEDMKEILEYAQKMGPEERKAFLTLLKSNSKK